MQTLNDLMSFGNVVVSDGRGNVSEPETTEYGPDLIFVYVDQDGQSIKLPGLADFDIDMAGLWRLGTVARFHQTARLSRCPYALVRIHPGWAVAFKPLDETEI